MSRFEVCAVALAEVFRGAGEILASPMGNVPAAGARLAKATFSPDLLMTDGVASLAQNVYALGAPPEAVVVEGYLPYRAIFDLVWHGRRHVVMGASQLDRFGNQNIACVGPFERPKSQLLGVRGAPGNTVNHPTSYWVPNHSTRVFVPRVDFVSGLGTDRAAALGPAGRFHRLGRVVTNLAVLDFGGQGGSARLLSVHPGVSVEEVVAATGFELCLPDEVPTTRRATPEESRLLREVIDPQGIAAREIP